MTKILSILAGKSQAMGAPDDVVYPSTLEGSLQRFRGAPDAQRIHGTCRPGEYSGLPDPAFTGPVFANEKLIQLKLTYAFDLGEALSMATTPQFMVTSAVEITTDLIQEVSDEDSGGNHW